MTPTVPYIAGNVTVPEILARRVESNPDFVYYRFEGQSLTVGEIDTASARLAGGLSEIGITDGDRVAVMLPQHPDYVVTYLALLKLGAVVVPINVHLVGDTLKIALEIAQPAALIADARYFPQLEPALAPHAIPAIVWRGAEAPPGRGSHAFDAVAAAPPLRLVRRESGDAPALIGFTSGTTGLPKGAILTDKMLRAAAEGCILIGDLAAGNVLHCWEPFYHVGGFEVLIAGILRPLTLALFDRFSASRFWDQVRAERVTRIHYIGGVLQLLLKQTERDDDRDHAVRIAWGGGCPEQIWRRFEQRFGVELREGYGMTETSSFVSVNMDGRVGSVGSEIPWFEMMIADDDGRPMETGALGEIRVRAREPGVLTRGYFNNADATAHALRDGWYCSGDFGRRDADGYYYFVGRKKDSLRRRGENISAWEVEHVINQHPDVADCAVIGVPNEMMDEDVKVFILPAKGAGRDARAIVEWCQGRMPYFQIPRFVAFVDGFARTPSERILKNLLPKTTGDCWDAERTGFRPQRSSAPNNAATTEEESTKS